MISTTANPAEASATSSLHSIASQDLAQLVPVLLELADQLDAAALRAAPGIAAAGAESRTAAVRVARDMAAANHLRAVARLIRSAPKGAPLFDLEGLPPTAAAEVARVLRERAETLRSDASAEATYLATQRDPRTPALALVRRLAQAALLADSAERFAAAAQQG